MTLQAPACSGARVVLGLAALPAAQLTQGQLFDPRSNPATPMPWSEIGSLTQLNGSTTHFRPRFNVRRTLAMFGEHGFQACAPVGTCPSVWRSLALPQLMGPAHSLWDQPIKPRSAAAWKCPND